jgi:hypothetical protein
MKKLPAILLFLFISISCSFAQKFDSTKTVMITLIDDTEIIGRIINQDSAGTTLRSLSGIISVIPKSQILDIKPLTGMLLEKNITKRILLITG